MPAKQAMPIARFFLSAFFAVAMNCLKVMFVYLLFIFQPAVPDLVIFLWAHKGGVCSCALIPLLVLSCIGAKALMHQHTNMLRHQYSYAAKY